MRNDQDQQGAHRRHATGIDRVAIFGGSFDPVHSGHLALANLAMAQLGLDQVCFVPCRQSPHKLSKRYTAATHRLAMLYLATENCPIFKVESWELTQPTPSFSYLTARYFRQQWPQAKLFWIVGTDQWQALSSWKNAEKLSSLVDFIVIQRQSYPPTSNAVSVAGARGHFLKADFPITSSALRRGQIQDSALPKVQIYQKDHHLYPITS